MCNNDYRYSGLFLIEPFLYKALTTHLMLTLTSKSSLPNSNLKALSNDVKQKIKGNYHFGYYLKKFKILKIFTLGMILPEYVYICAYEYVKHIKIFIS